MDPRTPPPSAAASPGALIEDRLSEQLTAALATARRRASRCGDHEVDTAHLLHSLLESDPVVRAFLGGGGPRTAKLLAYLAQRCIGYGLRWRYTVEETARPVAGGSDARLPAGWSPAAARAMEVALERVEARGAAWAEGVDLFAGLVTDPACRAAEVLRTAGADVRGLAAALAVGTGASTRTRPEPGTETRPEPGTEERPEAGTGRPGGVRRMRGDTPVCG